LRVKLDGVDEAGWRAGEKEFMGDCSLFWSLALHWIVGPEYPQKQLISQ
jgi:hypothetical protein